MIDGKKKNASGDSYTFRLKDNVIVSASFEAEAVTPETKYYTVTVAPNMANGKVLTSTGYAKKAQRLS